MEPCTAGLPAGTEHYTGYLDSPIGPLAVSTTATGIIAVRYILAKGEPPPRPPACLTQALTQLDEYFAGTRRTFSLPLLPQGTVFQTTVWAALVRIPFGQTVSYRDIAARIGRPRAVRAVGDANGCNSLNILIPCHRVVGADGSLTGYGGGLWRKQWLLDHERQNHSC
jgi:methylated-DNA-[protein]-cysteine S-methyltransferase